MIGTTPAGIKFISYGIGRTGSTSFHTLLKQYSRDKTKHQPRSSMQFDMTDYFKFCVVRNPWDRYVSMYHWGMTYGKPLADTFDDYIHRLINGKNFKSHKAHPNFSRLQIEWAMDLDGHIDCDYFGRFEDMETSCNFIFDKLKLNEKMIHIHGTQHKHYSAYYTPELRDKVHEYALLDIEHFNYKFEEYNE